MNPFFCYSNTLKKELLAIGERYITRTLNENTNKYCWVFMRTERLLEYLTRRKGERVENIRVVFKD